jgi:hypothetical protein
VATGTESFPDGTPPEAAQTLCQQRRWKRMTTAAAQPETFGCKHDVLNRSWRETLVDAAEGDSMLAALESARLLATDTAATSDVIYSEIQSFYALDNDQTMKVMTRLADELSEKAAAPTAA